MAVEFVLCDVFAERVLTGNPLAVVFGAEAFDDAARLALAREFNWSEITFVAPRTQAVPMPRVRIWTPRGELPFAGHPVIGSTVVCARRGLLPASGPATLALEGGPAPVEVEHLDAWGGMAWLSAGPPHLGEPLADATAVAAALGLPAEALDPGLGPPRAASVGSTFLIVPLRSLDAVRRLRPDPERLPALLAAAGARRPYVFTRQTLDQRAAVHARMLDVDREDPATGSAAGALGAYLVAQGLCPPGRLEIEQGNFVDRPSLISVEVSGRLDAIERVRIGGRVFVWAEGRLMFR